MELVKALRFLGEGAVYLHPPRLALVGAGGKTTAMFQLARELVQELYPAVLVTTTTHLGTHQTQLADQYLRIDKLSNLPSNLPEGVILFTGPEVEEGRLAAPHPEALERLLELANLHRIPLLIEADGARMRPLKAPVEHEPVIPSFVDHVIVVAGLGALGQPLNSQWVHRPERFTALSGLAEGEEIDPQALARVLLDPNGGLKGIPETARRVILLTQADTPERREAGKWIVQRCQTVYQAVILSTFLSDKFIVEDRVQHNRIGVTSVHEPTAILILAAGASSRFGRPKQLLEWKGQPLVRYIASLALATRPAKLRVVVGAYQEQVHRALEGLDLEIVENLDWQTGQASSVRAGIQGLPPEMGGALFLLVDQPQVPASLVQGLIDLHAQTLSPLVAPLCQGRRANPVLFDRVTFPDLLALQGDTGGRALFDKSKGYEISWLPWEDERLLWDLDTPLDYARLLTKAD